MQHEVNPIDFKTVLDYITLNHEVSDEPWVVNVMNPKTVRALLCSSCHANHRKAYGLFLGATMIGYAVVHTPTKTLDLLHIAEDFRGKGNAIRLLQVLDVERVTLDERNLRAVNLYTKLGYELEFYEDC